MPQYPEIAKKVAASGSVVVEIMIDESGNVIAARAVSGHPLLQAAAKGALPIIGRTLMLATRLSIDGPRYDQQFQKTAVSCDPNGVDAMPCPKQGTTQTGVVWDLVFSGTVERFKAKYALGLYNAMDWQYDTVPSSEFLQRTIRQRPRSVLASIALEF